MKVAIPFFQNSPSCCKLMGASNDGSLLSHFVCISCGCLVPKDYSSEDGSGYHHCYQLVNGIRKKTIPVYYLNFS
ncbi:hypothetical protein SK128_008474 [Halocaridina rubra]|uniref:Uncharacterized protein n=1 Tax=Halocaridina rubra TaxID=373956 RepID=A0AAN9AEM5_HALRR